MHKYILDANNQPVRCDDLLAWGRWFEASAAQRQVGRMEFDGGMVSTVFLGLDHSFVPGHAPLLWETMIFGGPHDGWQDRYASLEAARHGHQRAVEFATSVDAVDPVDGIVTG